MGGIPGAVGNAASAVGSGVSDAAKSFYGAAKDSVNNTIQPYKDAYNDMRGQQGPGQTPPAQGGPAQPPMQQAQNPAMQAFFNAPASETPAMRNRRMAAAQ